MLGLVWDAIRYNKHFQWSREDILALSERRFRSMLRWAYVSSPFYRDLYITHGIKRRDLAHINPKDLPIINKEMVRPNFDRIATMPVRRRNKGTALGENLVFLPGIGYSIHTSGSTGKPCEYLYSHRAVTTLESNFVRLSIGGGQNKVSFRDFPIKSLHISSVGKGYASMLLALKGLKRFHAQSVIIDVGAPLEEWPGLIGDFDPSYLSGYPSCIELLAGLQESGQIALRPKKIITGGEPLTKEAMAHWRDLFGGDVINYYGSTESILIGVGASWYDGIYLFDDLNYVEVDDMKRLIITPLTNRAFPLIRYRMDDIVEGWTREDTPPLPFTHIDKIAGRQEDLLWFENAQGKKDFLHPLFLDDLDIEGIERYQFVQTSKTDFTIRCVSLASDRMTLEAQTREQIDGMLRRKDLQNVQYCVEFVDRLKVDPQAGKAKMVVKEIE